MKQVKLHKFLAWTVGGWLALISLSGSFLLFKSTFLHWQYPQMLTSVSSSVSKAAVLNTITTSKVYQTIMFPSAEAPYYQAFDANGDIDYWDQNGLFIVTRYYLSDFISVLEQWHMNLLLNDIGYQLLNFISLLSLFLIITGLISWWPKHWSRRLFRVSFQFNLRIFRQWHTVMASIGFLFLLIPILTSIGMLYKQPSIKTLQLLFNDPVMTKATLATKSSPRALGNQQWDKWLSSARKLETMKGAELTRVYIRQSTDDLVVLRFKQADEWHQYGRNFVYLDPNTAEIKKVKDTHLIGAGLRWYQRIYPIHTANVGGIVFKIALLLVGILPILLLVTGAMYRKQLQKRASKK
ncbi:PepSY-associated TM helix domain-containing protein [Shewanella sp. T24-MNA-CIBAN-0130]|uniref:PepSY-associated TM helix domain-containing protein n=1 Tax=Shewanella sp. T24-MNA-CIBAN-0130 TaxID=3140470 RepID=UPI00332F802C